MGTWAPQQEGLTEVVGMVKMLLVGSTEVQHEMYQRFQHFTSTVPDFPNYLMYIVTQLRGETDLIRESAGMMLKSSIKGYKEWQPATREYIKTEIIKTLGDECVSIRNAGATCIAAIVGIDPLTNWPSLVTSLSQMLDSNSAVLIEGALHSLFNMLEDNPRQFNSEALGWPLNSLVPKILPCFHHSEAIIRRHAVGCIRCIICLQTTALLTNMDSYLQHLFQIAVDPDSVVRRRVCESIVILANNASLVVHLLPHMNDVVRYMLQASRDSDEEVAREACEIWSVLTEHSFCKTLLTPVLPELIGTLLDGMAYSEEDRLTYEAAEEDDHLKADREEDIKPKFHKSRSGVDSNAEDDDIDEVQTWNLRRCSAANLDILSNVFGDEILPVLLPKVDEKLVSPDWTKRESAILALGAIAEGCIQGISQHLPNLVPFFVNMLKDEKPLVRSIACWTLSRYSRWMIFQDQAHMYLQPVVRGLLERVMDKNKKVQQAACSAFATLEEEATTELLPYLSDILNTFVFALQSYQARNLLLVYDCIGTLAETIGQALDKPEFVNVLLPPLMEKLSRASPHDRKVLSMLECFTCLTLQLGQSMLPYAEALFGWCVGCVRNTLEEAHQLQANPDAKLRPEAGDKEFVVVALDLIASLCEGMGPSVEPYIAQTQLVRLLFECLKDPYPGARQSAFALVGDLVKAAVGQLRPAVHEYINILVQNLHPTHISVCNNACWALGEMAIRLPDDTRQYGGTVLQLLIPIMTNPTLCRSLLENTAITIGRFSIVEPALFAEELPKYFVPWCQCLRDIKDDVEKEDAFRGLCAVVERNPQAAMSEFVVLLDSIASFRFDSTQPDLRDKLQGLLRNFRQAAPAEQWESFLTGLPSELRANITPFLA
eukprot:Rmarinus@m.16216